jgi:hypothetical protein
MKYLILDIYCRGKGTNIELYTLPIFRIVPITSGTCTFVTY